MKIDLNVDLGEHDSEPQELYRLATVVNIACGGHAGDEASMLRSCRAAAAAGVRIAAHPSYPDREGFGRRSIPIARDELARTVELQCRALSVAALDAGLAVAIVKPHGALYHDSASMAETAQALLDGAREGLGDSLAEVVGPPGSVMADRARAKGLRFVREGFADRAYDGGGRLVPRVEPGALITDPVLAAEQALRLARGQQIDTICVHGDTPSAVAIAERVRRTLVESGLLRTGAA